MRAGRKEGEEKGRADGLREGKADGLKEGEAKGLRDALKVIATHKLGEASITGTYTLNPKLDKGLGDADTRHRFVFSGVWDINYLDHAKMLPARYLFGGWQLASTTWTPAPTCGVLTATAPPPVGGGLLTTTPPCGGGVVVPSVVARTMQLVSMVVKSRARVVLRMVGRSPSRFRGGGL